MDYATGMLFALKLLILGIAVGIVSPALGIGGGLLMVPAFLEFVPGMDPHTAKGTSLFIIIFVALLNSWRLNKGHENKMLRMATFLALGSVPGAFLGSWLTSLLTGATVQWIFFTLIILLGLRVFFLKTPTVNEDDLRQRLNLAPFIGFAAGLISGMTGIGGGAVLVPLVLMAGLCTNARVTALSNTVMIATSTAGALKHAFGEELFVTLPYTVGYVNLLLAPFIFIGAQLGAPFGKWINRHLTIKRRRIVMGLLLLLLAARIAMKASSN